MVNDFGSNRFYLNHEGLFFEEATAAFGLENEGEGMGAEIGDYDNDGFFDIYLTNISSKTLNPLFHNDGNGHFTDRAEVVGVHDAAWGWGNKFFDYDLDGDLDLYVVNGFIGNGDRNYFFENMLADGSQAFNDISAQTATDNRAEARALEVFDYDNDGDLEMVVANWNAAPHVYKNRTTYKGFDHPFNWLKIRLEGTVSNRTGFGASISVEAGGQSFHRLHHGVGFLGQSIKPLHFGLGTAKQIDELTVHWPSGKIQTVGGLSANKTWLIKESGEVVDESPEALPENFAFELLGCYPNPFSEKTSIKLNAPFAGPIHFEVFNILGQKLDAKIIIAEEAGAIVFDWLAAPAIYGQQTLLFRLSNGNNSISWKMLVIGKQ